MAKRNIGSSFDDFLKGESMLDDAEKLATHRVDAWIHGRGSEKEFFERGRKIAKLADQGLPIPSVLLNTSEEPEEDCLD